jgi:hypothetical protein
MPETTDTPTVPSALKRIALTLRLTSWIGFWFQLVLAVVATGLFLVGAFRFAQPSANAGASNAGTGGATFFAVCGLLVLYFSIYQAFRCVVIARKLLDPNPNLRPKKADTIQLLRLGLVVSLVGMLLNIVGAQAITGALVAKSLSQPQGVQLLDPQSINRLIQPLDILVVLANTHTITAHFAGIAASIWLMNRIAKQ